MTFFYVILAIVVLLILITVHEFGHYIFGKILGFKIEEFSIGFGKSIFSKTSKKTGEKFSIRIIPLGGYCAFLGEDEDNPSKEAFNNQKPWKRLIVCLGGVTFNFLFGIIMSVVFLLSSGYAVPQVNKIAEGNPYFQVGDVIKSVNGKSIEIYRHMGDLIANYGEDEEFTVTLIRNGETITQTVSKKSYSAYYYVSNPYWVEKNLYDIGGNKVTAAEFDEYISSFSVTKDSEGKYQYPDIADNSFKYYKGDELVGLSKDDLIKNAGVSISPDGVSIGFVYGNYAQSYGFFEALGKAWPFAFYVCGLIFKALAGIFTGATTIRDLGGTVTAVTQMVEISKMGFTQFLMLFPLLSFNLAIFNVLPIPALDGARAVFILIEMIARKPVPRKIEAMIHTIGLIILFALVIFLDIYHIFFLK
ncbi:MAG: RIP metalloprotease RseP [Clostridia bacterium]|nr:RIP metalloprotease RseP [Clostridia bacterium]